MKSKYETLFTQEIKNSGIDVNELIDLVWGRKEATVIQHIHDVICHDPVTKFRYEYYDLDRAENFENNLRRNQRIHEYIEQGVLPHPHMDNYGEFGSSINGLIPYSVHHAMFESIFQILGSDEQIKKHWQDILDYKITGCYVQTEIGTGSNVQGLETEAVFDKDTQEFIIHTPSVKAIKFWPGELGKMANHAVVFAKLIIDDESYGIHSFFMKIRDQSTHEPLPGIEVGDIGPKYGYFEKDNGYMKFEHVRVPRSAILSRYVNVTKEGMIELRGDPRVAYATMLSIRVTLISFAWRFELLNCNMAIRYGLKRTQFKSISNSNQERRIIEYQATQAKVTPHLAFGYSMIFMSKY